MKNSKVTTVTVLQRMLKLLTNGWTRGCDARDRSGRAVSVNSPRAVRFCIGGARFHAAPGMMTIATRREVTSFLLDAGGITGGPMISTFNDAPGRTKAEVIHVVRTALAMARKAVQS